MDLTAARAGNLVTVALVCTSCAPVSPATPCSTSPPLSDYQEVPANHEDVSYPMEATVGAAQRVVDTGALHSAETCIDSVSKDVVDLSRFDTPVKQQYGGRCSAYGLVAAMENRANQRSLYLSTTCNGDEPASLDLSETHQFWTQNFEYDSKTAVEKASKFPVMEERYWREVHYDGFFRILRHRLFGKPEKGDLNGVVLTKSRQLHQGPGLGPMTSRELCEAVKELERGNPVYLALSVNRSLYAMDSPVDPSPAPSGGHAVSIVGYRLARDSPMESQFIIKNSWGTKQGEVSGAPLPPGYQALPFAYCTASPRYCGMWAIKAVEKRKIDWDDRHPVR